VRDAFDVLADAGIPLAHSPLGPPQLGVKCGLNEAFIVRCTDSQSAIATINDGHRTGRIERSMLRPLLRGDAMAAWRPEPNGIREWILWTNDARGAPLRTLPPLAHAWPATLLPSVWLSLAPTTRPSARCGGTVPSLTPMNCET